VFKDRITPHWFHENTRFWYRNDLRGGTKEFILVDVVRATRKPAFDHAKLAAGLSKAAGAEYGADKLPFDSLEFFDEDKAIRFNVGDAAWKCDLISYECSRTDAKASAAPASETNSVSDAESQGRRGRDQRRARTQTALRTASGSRPSKTITLSSARVTMTRRKSNSATTAKKAKRTGASRGRRMRRLWRPFASSRAN